MKLKEKFDSIDQSKLNSEQKEFLSKIEKATKNFTSDNKEVNDKVEGALDKMIATFKEKMPEAIKTKGAKKEPKATAKKATAKPSRTSNPKRTVMSVAKEIRKDGESWADAQKRARAEINKDKKSAEKEVKTEMQKLMAFIKTRKELQGISGTDLGRDSVRQAKPRGRRISKDGNVYYENRENRIDRLAPNYPKDAPMLEKGGSVGGYVAVTETEDDYWIIVSKPTSKKMAQQMADLVTTKKGEKNKVVTVEQAKSHKKVLGREYLSKFELGGNVGGYDLAGHLGGNFNVAQNDGVLSGVTGTQYSGLVGETGAMSSGEMFENGGGVRKVGNRQYSYGRNWKNDHNHVNKSEEHEVSYKRKRSFEDGGDFQAGVYNDGGKIIKPHYYVIALEKRHNLQYGDSRRFATESEAITWGEKQFLKEDVGEVVIDRIRPNSDGKAMIDTVYRINKEYPLGERVVMNPITYEFGGDFQAGVYAEGGSLENHGIKEGDTFVKTISGGIQKVKDKNGNIVYINLATGERDSQPPLPFKDGGKVPEVIINKDGIRVSKMVEPKKKLTEKEWMAKYSESKEARAYKKGGSLEKYSEFIKQEFPRAKREANKYAKKYQVGYLVLVEKNNQDRIEVRLSNNFYDFPKNYQDSYDVLYETKVDYAEGGDIEAFSMRMVKGSGAKPTEVITEEKEVKFVKGGFLRDKRNEYLSKLSDKEADVWDKIGAKSGSEIRNNKKMLKEYAEGVEKMLKKESVGKGGFDQEDYDYYTDENAHLFNEFLVWNGYYEPEMTVEQKKWRKERFSDPKYKNYVADPEVITVIETSSSEKKSKNYIVKADIKSVTVNQKGMKYTFKGSDVLNGANILEKGSLLETKAIYIPKRDVLSVELKDGSEVKPSNGYWIKKDASGELFKPKSEKSESKFKIGDFVYNKRTKTIGVVRDVFDKGEVRTDADGVVSVSEITIYNKGNATHRKAKIAPSTQKELEKSSFEDGGKLKNTDSENEDCDDDDDDDDDYEKAEKGAVIKKKSGNPKMKEAMVLAKKIRKDGEKWTDAVKRAYAQLK